MDWQGLLFRDISVCMVIYIIAIHPLFIISWNFGKSIGFWKVSATIDYQRLLEASDYQTTIDYQTTFGSLATIDYDGAGASLVGLVGAAGWVLSIRRVKSGGWAL